METGYKRNKLFAKGGGVEVDVESLQEELRSLKVRIKSLEEKNTSEAYEQSKKLRSQLSYIQARLLHLGVGSTSFAQGGSVGKFDAVECAEKLADLSYGVWNKLNIDSGSEIYSSDATQKELAKEYRTAGIDKMFIEYNAKQRKEIAKALTDENQHSLRNYLALKGYLGEEEMANYVRIAKDYNKKGGSRNVLNPEIIKPTVSDISVYVPNRNILSITIEKDGKEMKLTGSDIMDGLYVKDGEFKRGGFIKTLRRWWKKLNGTWYYNEGNGWRRDRAFQNKSEDYEKGGRRTYKQVTRGYVDDTPYEYAKGGYVDVEGKLLKELQKLQRDLNSSRLQTYIEGDNSEEAMANKRERASKLARFNEVLAMLNDIQAKRKDGKFARGGVVVTSIKDIPNFQEELNAGRITYRGLGMGKVADDFYKLAGESGTRIKVKGKEYYITDTEFDTFSRDSSGKLRVKFDAPFRKFARGGDVEIPEKIEYSSMFSPIPRSTDNENVV